MRPVSMVLAAVGSLLAMMRQRPSPARQPSIYRPSPDVLMHSELIRQYRRTFDHSW